jgi:ubiquinone/menaquinone biosynthesis C-methylase UbiE
MDKARNRAEMPEGTNNILNKRTLENDHKILNALLKPNMSVLDVGCGSGAITSGIAEKVMPGRVIGVDISEHLLKEAVEKNKIQLNLSFESQDIFSLSYENEFDVVTASRVLQWLEHPEEALKQLKKAAREGGYVVILDYSHEKIEWSPAPPESMLKFHNAFLNWRENAGMNNRIADELSAMFSAAGLKDVKASDQFEITRRGDPDFEHRIDLYSLIAETRGKQMVRDSYITEAERMQAKSEFREWGEKSAQYQRLYLRCCYGKKND